MGASTLEPGVLYLKVFKDVAHTDIDLLMPGCRVKFSWYVLVCRKPQTASSCLYITRVSTWYWHQGSGSCRGVVEGLGP
jgi:hypothetical protein